MKFLNIPFIVITISTILGILLGSSLEIKVSTTLIGLFSSICALFIIWKMVDKPFSKTYIFTVAAIISFILFGLTLTKVHHPKNYPNHYTHFIPHKNAENSIGIQFSIKERLKPTSFYNVYIASIKRIHNKKAKGLLLIRTQRKDSSQLLDVGSTYITCTQLESTPKPLNPNQFDYSNYLSKRYIYHRATVSFDRLLQHNTTEKTSTHLAHQIRNHINTKLSSYNITSKQLSIINALLLGQRQNISQETFKQYRDAGAIHILAMSGLHIGILLYILNFLLHPLESIKKYGKTIKLIFILLFLWCFAGIAGFSPSILRAVTMFSFLAIAVQIKSEFNTYNSLFISAFILLCFNPQYLFSAGFQLSYLAVFAIVWIQPKLDKLYKPKFFIDKKIWQTFTVTIAAQLGLLPLILFYFHQFPILFFISNLIIIPFLGGVLVLGFSVILLSLVDLLPEIIVMLLAKCIDFMNNVVGWVAHQDAWILKNIPFSVNMLIVSYFALITFILMFQKLHMKRVRLALLSITAILLVLSYEKHKSSRSNELIVFHRHYMSTIGVLKNQKLKLYSSDTIFNSNLNYLIGNYLTTNKASLDSLVSLKNTYNYKKQQLLIIDQQGIYNIESMKPDVIILSNSPKINLNRMIDSLKPRQIVADGSNYTSLLDRWEKSCLQSKTPFHRTDKKGAYILK